MVGTFLTDPLVVLDHVAAQEQLVEWLAWAGTSSTGRKSELYQAYHACMEDQLGLVLTCITLVSE
ncbi:hypothetical protein [Actinoplanes sp. TFC3]|uniref:hypothetical protein n=1 Tax=Actinoplanes sp. TFC3 TaxID=1710355 RepID=UPI00082E812A|nr:hypothetical protein [Actinoplanes sp. TFC3]